MTSYRPLLFIYCLVVASHRICLRSSCFALSTSTLLRYGRSKTELHVQQPKFNEPQSEDLSRRRLFSSIGAVLVTGNLLEPVAPVNAVDLGDLGGLWLSATGSAVGKQRLGGLANKIRGICRNMASSKMISSPSAFQTTSLSTDSILYRMNCSGI